jgi:hypothetical protein
MKPIIAAPLVAIVLAGAGVGAYYAVAGAGSGEEALPGQATTAQPSPTPTPVATVSPTPGEGATLTYVDPTYGYSFEYPATWFISPDSGIEGYSAVTSYDPRTAKGIGGIPQDELKVEIYVLKKPTSLDLEDWIAQLDRESTYPPNIVSEAPITVDNVAGTSRIISDPSFSANQYFFDRGAVGYLIQAFPTGSALIGAVPPILQTLRFNR